MSDPASSRFTPQNKTTHERLSTQTVGLVQLSDFRKRRAEVLEQQVREAREAAFSGTSNTPDRSQTGTPDNAGSDSAAANATSGPPLKKKKKKQAKKLLSFGDDDEENDDASGNRTPSSKTRDTSAAAEGTESEDGEKKNKFKANANVIVAPRAMTKAALRKEAAERETLRREFLKLQAAVKATEIAIPFVFYDGSNIPGGTVRVKKGDFVWVFLDKSRKVGAERGVGEKANPLRQWARVGVDDLMIVRGTIIIPHHYEFYFFALNQSVGPDGQPLFNFSNEAPKAPAVEDSTDANAGGMQTAASKAAAAAAALPDIQTLEGATDDPTLTKVVDRRWYERNKHIYPASTWQEFDPEKDYETEIRKDGGGNTFFFSK